MAPALAAPYTVNDLAYDPVTHTTKLPNGQDVPHVTHILSSVGVAKDFEELAEYGPRMAERLELARSRGTAVHADCHAYDDDDLVIEKVDRRSLPYLEAWIECRAVVGLRPIARERQLFHRSLCVTGWMDGIFETERRGKILRILADLKTGDPESAGAHQQTAAYEGAWLDMGGEPVDERWAIWLQPGQRIPYRIVNYTARADSYLDFARFQASLTTYHEQPERRRRAH